MTNLTEVSIFESGVYQLETDDPVLGGAPAFDAGLPITGHSNAQAQQLANRTLFLKSKVDDLANSSDQSKGASLIGYKGRTLATRLAHYPLIQDFGAAVDGVTDDTDAVRLAAASGGVVLIEGPVYIKGGIALHNGTRFVSVTRKGVIIADKTFVHNAAEWPWAAGVGDTLRPVFFNANFNNVYSNPDTVALLGLTIRNSGGRQDQVGEIPLTYYGALYSIAFANTDGHEVIGCKLYAEEADGLRQTILANYAVCKRFKIKDNEFYHQKNSNLGGGTIWVQNVNGYAQTGESITEDFEISGNYFEKDSHDEIISIFCRQGSIRRGQIHHNRFLQRLGQGSQNVMLTTHSVLDFTPNDWSGSTVIEEGAFYKPVTANGYYYKATVGGTTGASEPTWPTVVNRTVVDGGVTWSCCNTAPQDITWHNNEITALGTSGFVVRFLREEFAGSNADENTTTKNIRFKDNTLYGNAPSGKSPRFLRVESSKNKFENISIEGNKFNHIIQSGQESNTYHSAIDAAGCNVVDNTITGNYAEGAIIRSDLARNNNILLPASGNINSAIRQCRSVIGNRFVSNGDVIPNYVGIANEYTSGNIWDSGTSVINMDSFYGERTDLFLNSQVTVSNLILSSNTFSTGGGWVNAVGTIGLTANATNGPLNQNEGVRLINSGGTFATKTYTTSTPAASDEFVFYVFVQNNSSSTTTGYVGLAITESGGQTSGQKLFSPPGGKWTMIAVKHKFSAAAGNVGVELRVSAGANFFVCHSQLTKSSSPMAYDPTV